MLLFYDPLSSELCPPTKLGKAPVEFCFTPFLMYALRANKFGMVIYIREGRISM